MVKSKLVGAIAILSLTAACTAAVEDVRDTSPQGTDFTSALAKEYRDLAIFEADQMYDYTDAERFAEKGLMAAQGTMVMPSSSADWYLDPAFVPEAEKARAQLIAALDGGARESNPVNAARAQVKFDCWLEQSEEDFQNSHIAACRDEFFALMSKVEKKAECGPVTYICFFGFDSDVVDLECQETLTLVDEERQACGDPVVAIEGHTDTSGSSAYNMGLSLRRADNATTELVKLGVPSGIISATAKGEKALRVPTGDNVRERENRRVEITIKAR